VRIIKTIIKKILKNGLVLGLHNRIYNIIKINKKSKIVIDNSSFLHHCKIRVKGENNLIEIKHGCKLQNMMIDIYGSDTHILIEDNVMATDLQIWCEDKGNKIIIGNSTTIHGRTKLSCIEGTQIRIGSDCMFSSDIVLATGDSHSILDDKNNRINPSMDIVIEDHVWIGQKSTILKGSHILQNSIVGAASLCTKKYPKGNSVIAGVPGRIVKENVNWDRYRL